MKKRYKSKARQYKKTYMNRILKGVKKQDQNKITQNKTNQTAE